MKKIELNDPPKMVHRSTMKNPKLLLNPEKINFFEMTIDDFSIEDYNPMIPQLKLELGI